VITMFLLYKTNTTLIQAAHC